jgi:hypothetical protein
MVIESLRFWRGTALSGLGLLALLLAGCRSAPPLPDDPEFPAEAARRLTDFALEEGDETETEVLLRLAGETLDAAKKMAERGRADHAVALCESYVELLEEGIVSQFGEEGDPEAWSEAPPESAVKTLDDQEEAIASMIEAGQERSLDGALKKALIACWEARKVLKESAAK